MIILCLCMAMTMAMVMTVSSSDEITTVIPTMSIIDIEVTKSDPLSSLVNGTKNSKFRESASESESKISVNKIKQSLPNSLNISENTISIGPVVSEWDTWEAPTEIKANCRYFLSGHDFDGRPIFITEAGHLNLRKLVQEGGESLANFDKFVKQAAYRGVQAIKEASTDDSPVTQAIIIIDFADLNLFQFIHLPTLTHVLNIAREYRSLVDEICYKFMMLNVNVVASSFLSLVKPIFGNIFERVEIYGTNRIKWIPHVLELCPKDQVPEHYGGVKGYQPVKDFG